MKLLKEQLLPIILTAITCLLLIGVLLVVIMGLNLLPTKEKIIPVLHLADILIGITIYLKTSVDFALFIGMLMRRYTGYKNRIGIEIGTAVGNGVGTFLVLSIWTFFKEVPFLLVLMILLAALILFVMAEDSLTELLNEHPTFKNFLTINVFNTLHKINSVFAPITRHILPNFQQQDTSMKTFWALTFFAFSIPFILGLDDFAGYIPLFTIVNVFGFSIGVFVGHMILNILLFASPTFTVRVIRQPVIILLGSFAFIGIALWGIYEVYGILFHLLF